MASWVPTKPRLCVRGFGTAGRRARRRDSARNHFTRTFAKRLTDLTVSCAVETQIYGWPAEGWVFEQLTEPAASLQPLQTPDGTMTRTNGNLNPLWTSDRWVSWNLKRLDKVSTAIRAMNKASDWNVQRCRLVRGWLVFAFREGRLCVRSGPLSCDRRTRLKPNNRSLLQCVE